MTFILDEVVAYIICFGTAIVNQPILVKISPINATTIDSCMVEGHLMPMETYHLASGDTLNLSIHDPVRYGLIIDDRVKWMLIEKTVYIFKV